MGFDIDQLRAAEKTAVANSLYFKGYCVSWLDGVLDMKLEMQRQVRYYQAFIASTPVPSSYLKPEHRNTSDSQWIGRLGHVTLCHLNVDSVLWLHYSFFSEYLTRTSPGWLGLIEKEYIERLFTEKNHSPFWCKTQDCRTNARGRWEALVKGDFERDCTNAPDSGADNLYDYIEALFASQEGSFQNW
jgi:hypothetical protein